MIRKPGVSLILLLVSALLLAQQPMTFRQKTAFDQGVILESM